MVVKDRIKDLIGRCGSNEKAAIVTIGAVGVVAVIVIGGLVFFSMVRSANDQQAAQQNQLNQQAAIAKMNACITEKNNIEQIRANLASKFYVCSGENLAFNQEVDSYNARCANQTTNYGKESGMIQLWIVVVIIVITSVVLGAAVTIKLDIIANSPQSTSSPGQTLLMPSTRTASLPITGNPGTLSPLSSIAGTLSNFHLLGSRCPTSHLIMYILLRYYAQITENYRMIRYPSNVVKITLG